MLIDRYLAKEIVQPLLLGLGLFMLIFVGYTTARELSAVAQGSVDLLTAGKLVGLTTLTTLEVLLPSALFFSIISVLGRLYHDGEMAALAAAGVSPLRLVFSIGRMALLFAILAGILSIVGRPWAFRHIYQLESQAATQMVEGKVTARNFVPIGGSKAVFIADEIDAGQNRFQHVFVQRKNKEDENANVIMAASASMPRIDVDAVPAYRFYDGFSYVIDQDGAQKLIMEFKEMAIVSKELEKAHVTYRRKATATDELAKSTLPKEVAEFQWRVSTPLATLFLAMLAVPVSASQPRQPRLRNTVKAGLTYLGLFMSISLVRTLVEDGKIPAAPGLWIAYIPPALLLVAMLYRRRR